MLYFKESYDKQLDQVVEPQIPSKVNPNSNQMGSVAEKSSISQIDIGLIDKSNKIDTESFLKCQDFELSTDVYKDVNNQSFPSHPFKIKLTNGEKYKQDWLCWNKLKQSLYFSDFVLYINEKNSINVFLPFTKHPGWNIDKGRRKLKDINSSA